MLPKLNMPNRLDRDRVRRDLKEDLVYPYDYMIVFPRRSGGEKRRGRKRFNQDRFVRKLLALKKVKWGATGQMHEISGLNRIFRSDRCYLNADGTKNRPHKPLYLLLAACLELTR